MTLTKRTGALILEQSVGSMSRDGSRRVSVSSTPYFTLLDLNSKFSLRNHQFSCLDIFKVPRSCRTMELGSRISSLIRELVINNFHFYCAKLMKYPNNFNSDLLIHKKLIT